MGAEDLLSQNSFHPNQEDEHQNLVSEADLNEQAWQQDQGLEAGAGQDLRRSEETAALNELLLANGVEKGNIDALLLGDAYSNFLTDAKHHLPPELSPTSLSQSLVVIDQSLSNWRELAVSAPTACEVVILSKQQDGISQISEHLLQRKLNGYSELNMLTIVSSKGNGDLQLGSTQLATEELYSYTEKIANWKEALSIKAKITIFDGILPGTDEAGTFNALLADLVGTAVNDGDALQAISASTGVSTPEEHIAENSEAGAYGNGTVEHFSVVGQELVSDLNAFSNFQAALEQANKTLTELPNQNDFGLIIKETFGKAGSEEQRFAERLNNAETDLRTHGLGITVELRSEEDLKGAKGAYTSLDHSTQTERIYLNADWIGQGVSSLAIAFVLLEESGHSLDNRLNGELDSQGDEGEAFANKVLKKGEQNNQKNTRKESKGSYKRRNQDPMKTRRKIVSLKGGMKRNFNEESLKQVDHWVRSLL